MGSVKNRLFFRSGKIGAQMLALLLLALSLGVILAAYRSLTRDFRGMVVSKITEEAVPPHFWVFLVSPGELQALASPTPGLCKDLLEQNPRRRVGISGIIFEQVLVGQTLGKAAFSPFVYVEDERYLDQGVYWGILGLLGIVLSIVVYRRVGEDPASPEQTGEKQPGLEP